MAKQIRVPFQAKGDYVCTKNFRFVGRDFTAGQEFPWRQMSCSVRKLLRLYEGRFINVAGDQATLDAETPPTPELSVEDQVKDTKGDKPKDGKKK